MISTNRYGLPEDQERKSIKKKVAERNVPAPTKRKSVGKVSAPAAPPSKQIERPSNTYGDTYSAKLLAEAQAELEAVQRQISGPSAAHDYVEILTLKVITDIAKLRQVKLRQSDVDSASELKRLKTALLRIGRVVGENSTWKIAKAVEARLGRKGVPE